MAVLELDPASHVVPQILLLQHHLELPKVEVPSGELVDASCGDRSKVHRESNVEVVDRVSRDWDHNLKEVIDAS